MEAAALGMQMPAQCFDVSAPPWNQPLPPRPYTHMYYFATPRIPAGQPSRFNPGIFAILLDAYVTGLARSADWMLPRAVRNTRIWYPSTVFVEQPDQHFGEYTAAKACGEALCRQLSAQAAPLQVVADRLPRLPTDQTQGLTAVEVGTVLPRFSAVSHRPASLAPAGLMHQAAVFLRRR